jgi:hypothetical protein
MPKTESNPPRGASARIIVFAVAGLLGICLIGLYLGGYFHGSQPVQQTEVAGTPVQTAPPSPVPAPGPAAPGTVVTAGEVLDKLDAWLKKNPNYHALVETTLPNGAVMGRMDVFALAGSASGQVLRISAQMFLPQMLRYQAKKQNGKLDVYFPVSDQLVEADAAKMIATLPTVAANQTGVKGLLKMAKSSFAEASADLRVVTMVFNAETLNLPETSGDIYLSLRTNDQGKLLGVEEQAQGQRLITSVKYVSFDRDLIAREAPELPAGKVAVTNKTLQAAMKEEALHIINKPLGTKI